MPAAGQRNDGCFPSTSGDGCTSYWLVQLSLLAPAYVSSEVATIDSHAAVETHRAFGPQLLWRLGYMRTVAGEASAGIALLAGRGSHGNRAGVELVYRTGPGDPFDAAAGVGYIRATVDGFTQRGGNGLTSHVQLVYHDFALTAGYDRVWTDWPDRTDDGLFHVAESLNAGVTMHQRAAIWGTGGVGLLAAGYVLLYWLTGPDE